MITAAEYWEERFGEKPNSDADKLAIIMMREYAERLCAERTEKSKATNAICPNCDSVRVLEFKDSYQCRRCWYVWYKK